MARRPADPAVKGRREPTVRGWGRGGGAADNTGVRLFLAFSFAAVLAAGAAATEPTRRVALFDFEETNDAGVKLGSGLTLPRSWAPIGRDPGTGDPGFASVPLHRELIRRGGHPVHNQVGYAPDPDRPGAYVLRLTTSGGDAGAYLAAGAVPAEPGGSYTVTLRLGAGGTGHAGVRVRSSFVDRRGRRVPGTGVEAAPAGVADAGGWQPWTLHLEAPEAPGTDVASIGLEVSLRQPRRDPLDPLGDQRVLPVETAGVLLVDDVEVRRLPVAELTTRQVLQVVRLPARPELRLRVRDLEGQALRARLVVRDLDGQVVDQALLPADVGGVVRWKPALPRLGWYEATAEVVDPAGTPLLRRRLAFTHAPPRSATPPARGAPRFLLDATELPLSPAEAVGIAAAADLPGVLLAGWTPELTLAGVAERAEALGRAARELDARGIGLEVALGPEPAALAAASPVAGRALADPSASWWPWVEPLVVAVGGRAARWWVAEPASALLGSDAPAAATPALHQLVRDWAAGSRVVGVGAADRAATTRTGAGTAAAAAAAVAPLTHAAAAAAGDGPEVLALSPGLREPAESHRVAAERFANTLLDLRVRDPAARVAMGSLVRVRQGQPEPGPLLAVAERLAAWTAVEGAAIFWAAAPGVEGWILPGGVALVRSREERGGETWLPLGDQDQVEVGDAWGNRWRVTGQSGEGGVRVGRMPLRLSGFDPGSLATRGSFRLDRPLLEAMPGPHPRRVLLTNGHDAALRGTLALEAPAGWTVRPARLSVSLAPGESASLPVALEFPGNAAAGPASLRGRLEHARQGPRSLPLRAPLELGLPGLRLQASLAVDPQNGRDLLATCVAFNDGDEPASLSVYAQAAGQPFRERLAPRVEPGGLVVFRFRFAGAAEAAAKTPVLCGVRRSGRPGALNRHLLLGEAEAETR